MWMVVVFSAFDIIFFRFPQSTFHFVNRTVARSQINNMIIIYQILVCARLNINIHHRCGGAVFLEQKIDPHFRYTFFVFCRTYRRAYCTSCQNFLCCADTRFAYLRIRIFSRMPNFYYAKTEANRQIFQNVNEAAVVIACVIITRYYILKYNFAKTKSTFLFASAPE